MARKYTFEQARDAFVQMETKAAITSSLKAMLSRYRANKDLKSWMNYEKITTHDDKRLGWYIISIHEGIISREAMPYIELFDKEENMSFTEVSEYLKGMFKE